MNPFIILGGCFIFVLIFERKYPRIQLATKPGWLSRALFFNALQLAIVIVSGHTWDVWLEGPSLFKLPWSPFVNGIFAYICATWVFYWWHYLRHENNALWLTIHQFHHSPVRIEALTSFYKHPLEVFLNSWIMAVLTCPVLGLDAQTNAWLTIFLGLAEFFYHANISTPRWIGYIIQRPESHLYHHKENKQFTWNYGDLAIWDMLNGTWFNPTEEDLVNLRTGFSDNRETKVKEMLTFRNVLTERPKRLPKDFIKCGFISLLFLLGTLNTIGVVFNSPELRGFAAMTTASPLPFVFSAYNGVETFSTAFLIEGTFYNFSTVTLELTHKLYGKLKGPYNRRNVIGSVFSHGPFFDHPNLIEIRQQILKWAFCGDEKLEPGSTRADRVGVLSREFGIDEPLNDVTVHILSKTAGNEHKEWTLFVDC